MTQFKITISGDRETIAHFDNIINNLPVAAKRYRVDTGNIVVRELTNEVHKRKKWLSGNHFPRLRGSFYMDAGDKDSMTIRSLHPLAKAIDKGIQRSWNQPNNPIWRGKVHPPNRPMNYVKPAVKTGFEITRKRLNEYFDLNILKQ